MKNCLQRRRVFSVLIIMLAVAGLSLPAHGGELPGPYAPEAAITPSNAPRTAEKFLFTAPYASKYDPGPGKTLSLIGQTFQSEYQGYKAGTGLTPSGGSHYGTLYGGTIEQGDDAPDGNFLDYIRSTQNNPYALVAISIKDNTAAGGYGQMLNPAWGGFNANAVWEACNAISNGVWDDQIDDYAAFFNRRADVKFFLRIGYEVSLFLFAYNGSRYANDWLTEQADAGVNVFENPDAVAELDRQAYIDAYNHIAQRIRRQAGNVAFVFHPVRGFNDTRWLYPGDQYVDYVGFSIFNNDVCLEVNATFNCQGDDIDPQLQQSMDFAKARGKPLMIAESAAQAPATDSPSVFNAYLDKLHHVVVHNDVRVLAYINSDWPAHGWDANWGDSRVEVNTSVLDHYLNVFGSHTRYVHGGGSTTATCDDGIQNQNETGVDCGGVCPDCDPPPTDCTSPSCPSSHPVYLCGQCWESQVQAVSGGCAQSCDPAVTPSCSDGVQNGAETGVDCGGVCPPCHPATGCTHPACPSSHPVYLCARCWESQAQAASGGCNQVCDRAAEPG